MKITVEVLEGDFIHCPICKRFIATAAHIDRGNRQVCAGCGTIFTASNEDELKHEAKTLQEGIYLLIMAAGGKIEIPQDIVMNADYKKGHIIRTDSLMTGKITYEAKERVVKDAGAQNSNG